MAVGRKQGRTGTTKGRKRKSGKNPLLIDRGRLFLLSGVVAILCVLLLFINVLYGGTDAPVYGSGSVFAGTPSAGTAPAGARTVPPVQSLPAGVGESAALPPEGAAPRDGTGTVPAVPAASAVPVPAATSASSAASAASSAATDTVPIQIQPRERVPVSDIPQAREGARLVFVIDDAGQNLEALRHYLDIPMPLAVAVLPKLAGTKEAAAMVLAAGKELMLHQPMQAENRKLWAGPGAVTPQMGLGEIKALVTENLVELGDGVRGLNNHEGSLITEDEVRIGAVLDVAQERGLFFMDSRTTPRTKVPEAARIRGMQILERDVFIDNVLEREAMLAQIREGLVLANKQGSAIMIGHVDKSADILPVLLTELAPVLKERGYEIVTPSRLLDR